MKRTSEDYIICYFDILGYKNIITRNCIEEKDFIEIIRNITKMMSSIKNNNFFLNITPKIYCFSDNFIICIKYDKESVDEQIGILSALITCMQIVQCKLNTLNTILVRGSIVRGKLYCGKNFIYGDGLINAYMLENEIARYPRIIIQKEFMENIIAECKNLAELFDLKKVNINERNVFCWHNKYTYDIVFESNLITKEEHEQRYNEEKEDIKVIRDFDGNYIINFLEAINFYEDDFIEEISMKEIYKLEYKKTIEFYFRNFSDNLEIVKKLLWCCDYANKFFLNSNEEKMFNKNSILNKTHVNLDKICKKFLIEYARKDNTKNEKMHLEYLINTIEGL